MARRSPIRPWMAVLAIAVALVSGLGLVMLGTSTSTGSTADAASLASPAARATGTAVVLTGRQARPLVRVRGLGALRVDCVGGVPSAAWRSEPRSASQVVGIAERGSPTRVRQLEPGQVVRPRLGRKSVSTWQIGLISQREAIVATITLTVGGRDDGSCLAATQVLVTATDRSRETLTP